MSLQFEDEQEEQADTQENESAETKIRVILASFVYRIEIVISGYRLSTAFLLHTCQIFRDIF